MHLCVYLRMSMEDLQREAFLASQVATAHGITQTTIAAALGISQSQVSRVLSGNARRPSKVFNAVCKYVHSSVASHPGESLKHHPELIEAVSDVWDGTPDHAQALALVIRSLGALRSRVRKTNPTTRRPG